MNDACLVFDFDGTILDTEEPIYRSWAELWDDHGHELALAAWQATIGTDSAFDPWAELERRMGCRLDPALRERRRARRDELQAGRLPRAGVVEWLAEAERLGVPVGVASSSPPDWVEGHLRRLGLRACFLCVVCADGMVPAKPDPTSYRLACERLGADPRQSVAVEDSPHGVAAAVATGLFTVAVPHRLTRDLDLSAADLVVASLDTLTVAEVVGKARRRLIA
jgi:HAD superfamily hydrolase (TIGR01509 family)